MTKSINDWKTELVDCIHFLHQKGYAPATSSNYSFRIKGADRIHISSSGIDKGTFSTEDLMEVDLQGQVINDTRKSSAETLLHTMIYEERPELQCVLHTHTIYNTVLSRVLSSAANIRLEGFEVLKGLSGVTTHDTFIDIPIFQNSQDIATLAEQIRSYWQAHPDMQGFLLAGHGLYSWGKSIAAAKRQIEVMEFLFECYYKIKNYKK